MKKTMVLIAVLALLLTLASCNRPAVQSPGLTPPAASPSASADVPGDTAAENAVITICSAGDKPLFVLRPCSGGYDILGESGEKSGSIKVESDRVKVKDGSGKVLWKLKKKESGCKVYDEKEQEVLKIKGAKGDCRIKDAGGNEVGRIKPGKDGLKIDGTGKVESESGAVLVYQGKSLLYRVKGAAGIEEAAFLGLPGGDMLQKIGMMVYFRDIR